jgi:outer membrane protein assembly factor BamB
LGFTIIRRVRTAPATLSWALVLASGLSTLVVSQAPTAQKTRAPEPFTPAWTLTLDGDGPFRLAADASHVFVLDTHPSLAARAAADGRSVWSADPGPITGLDVSDALVFAVTRSEVRAFDQSDGRTRWTAELPVAGSAPVWRAGWLVVAAGSQIIAFRATDGTRLWQAALPGAAAGSPVIDGDRIFLALENQTVAAVHITTGNLDWTRDVDAKPGDLRAAAGQVYFGGRDGNVFALTQSSGSTRWRVRLRPPVIGRPAADAGRVYVAAYDNAVRAYDRSSGALKWVCDLGERPADGPIPEGTELVVPLTSGNLARCAAGNGHLAGQVSVPEAVMPAPDLRYQLESAAATADGASLYRVLIVGDGRRILTATRRTGGPSNGSAPGRAVRHRLGGR